MSVNSKLTAIADEIRVLSGVTEAMGLDAMATNVNAANTEVADQEELIDQIILALEQKAYNPPVEQASPEITVDSSGLITATVSQEAGNVAAGTKTVTQQLTTQEEKTIVPTRAAQVAVATNVFTTGEIAVAPIPDDYIKVAAYIENGVLVVTGED